MTRLLMTGCSALALFCCGCGSDMPTTVPVAETVTLNGKPLEGATVNFLSDESNITASGKTDASGKFSVRTFVGTETVDGAVVGTHAISVVKTESSGPQMGDPKEMMAQMTTNPAVTSEFKSKNVVPEKYGNPTMSGLTVTIPEGGKQDVQLELKGSSRHDRCGRAGAWLTALPWPHLHREVIATQFHPADAAACSAAATGLETTGLETANFATANFATANFATARTAVYGRDHPCVLIVRYTATVNSL